jgi:secreted PhoX family phosphatase
VAVYQGCDERNEYIYKFVSSRKFIPGNTANNREILDNGILYVAKFNADGTGQWLPLVHGTGGLTAANGFADQGEVVIKARQAADVVGATMMDRPEWIAIHPTTREVYCALTNNNRRGTTPASVNTPNSTAGGARPPVDAANPRERNLYGHIIRWTEDGNDVKATSFIWEIFVLAGDKTKAAANLKGDINGSTDSSADFGAPDGLWFDKDGRLWIQTDQQGDGTGDFDVIGTNSMSCADPSTREIKRFLTSPPNCEVTGVVATPDNKTFFVGIQHPGEDWTGSLTSNSTWPDNGLNGPTTLSSVVPVRKPRSSMFVVTKDDGGIIGT